MGAPIKLNFKMYQGSTFSEILRWESSKKVYKTITSIPNVAPCVITTSTAHGIPNGWRVKITNVGGMKELNSSDTYRTATVLTGTTFELNDINAVGFTAYTSGGIVEYNEPVDLTGFTARMQLRADIADATIIDEYTTENSNIIINTTDSTININVSAVDTAAYTFTSALYSLELISPTSVVTQLCVGKIDLVQEVTR